MKHKNIFCKTIAICLWAATLTGCQGAAAADTVGATQGMTAEEVANTFESEELLTDWKSQKYKTIQLEGGSVEINSSGVYELTGTLKDGSISVNVDKNTDEGTVYLVLNNAFVTSDTTAPIYIKEAEKVVLILEEGTTNAITQGKYVETDEKENPSSAIFSKASLTISGKGVLTVVSEFNDGITSKDNLLITGGTIQVTALNDGITGKDLLAIETADITIDAGKDGMRATNDTETSKGNITIADGNFQITAGNDAIQAEQILQVDGGNFDLNSGGGYPGQSIKTGSTGQSREGMRPNFSNGETGSGDVGNEDTALSRTAETETAEAETVETEIAETETETATENDSKKGLKAGSQLIVNGGNFTISSYEDSLHSNGSVTISGGIWNIESGDDAIHADTAVLIEKGELTIANSYEGIEGSDITIKDGTISVVSSNDGLNVSSQSGTLTIDGGVLEVTSGGDGLDSNGNIVQNGGAVTIHTDKVGAGDTPVDYDGTFTSNGGTLVDQNGDAINYENQQMGGGRGQMRPDGAAGPSGQNQAGQGQTGQGQEPPESALQERMQRRKGGAENESSSEDL